MPSKPKGCLGCTLYDNGGKFIPDQIIPNSPIFILADVPLTDREIAYLSERAGVDMENMSHGSLLRCHKSYSHLPPAAILKPAINHCNLAHLRIPPETKLVIGLGKQANNYLGCPGSVSSWRGFTYEVKID
jgi:hypothetical protein